MTDEPFGRQPEPVTVLITGNLIDTVYWARELARRAEFKDDLTQKIGVSSFKIYPRAVND